MNELALTELILYTTHVFYIMESWDKYEFISLLDVGDYRHGDSVSRQFVKVVARLRFRERMPISMDYPASCLMQDARCITHNAS